MFNLMYSFAGRGAEDWTILKNDGLTVHTHQLGHTSRAHILSQLSLICNSNVPYQPSQNLYRHIVVTYVLFSATSIATSTAAATDATTTESTSAAGMELVSKVAAAVSRAVVNT